MVLLEFGSNNCIFTLTEKTTITNPDYIFVFVDDHTGKKYACTATDISAYTSKYNKFNLIVGSSNIPLSGQIGLVNYGFYHYYVYQSSDASTFDYTNIDTTDLRTLTGLVETGKMFYKGIAVTNNYYKDTRSSIKTYND